MAKVSKSSYGTLPDGTNVEVFVLKNQAGITARIMTLGATLIELQAPDRSGAFTDITLGFDTLEGWLGDGNPYMGCTVGRYANRIAKGRFTLEGKEYTLAINNGPNALHGGLVGFNKKVWQAEVVDTPNGASVRFTCTSPDGEEGYPGAMRVSVQYTLTDDNELRLDYTATTDRTTVVNLTNHTYWNLAGEGNVLNHVAMLPCSRITAVDAESIPTGELAPVAGTPFDFTKPQPIGARLDQLDNTPAGYDHNFVIDGADNGKPTLAARVEDPTSGRVLEVLTTEPGVQFYTGNHLDGTLKGKQGRSYKQHAGFCLETQHFPDSPNQPHFPSTGLRPGETYRQTTVHRFSTTN